VLRRLIWSHITFNSGIFTFLHFFFGTTKDDVQAALLLTMNVDGDYWLSKLKKIQNYLKSINELNYKSSEELADRLWKSSNIVYKSYD